MVGSLTSANDMWATPPPLPDEQYTTGTSRQLRLIPIIFLLLLPSDPRSTPSVELFLSHAGPTAGLLTSRSTAQICHAITAARRLGEREREREETGDHDKMATMDKWYVGPWCQWADDMWAQGGSWGSMINHGVQETHLASPPWSSYTTAISNLPP